MPLPVILIALAIFGVVRFLSSREASRKQSARRPVARRARPEPVSGSNGPQAWKAPDPTERLTTWEDRQRRARGMREAPTPPAPQTPGATQPIRLDPWKALRGAESPVEDGTSQQPAPEEQSTRGQTPPPARGPAPTAAPRDPIQPPAYPGDFEGPLPAERIGRSANIATGDVVLARVPAPGDHSQGAAGPVLIVGHEPGWLLGVAITTDVEPGAADRVDIGVGEWNGIRAEAQVLTGRILRIHEETAEETGQVVSRSRMLAVARQLRRR